MKRSSFCLFNLRVAASSMFAVFGCAGAEFGSAGGGDGEETGSELQNEGIGGGCAQFFFPPIPENIFLCGSYEGRSFLIPHNHLGCDIALAEGIPVRAVADGRIVYYSAANGYGRLAVVIEVELPHPAIYTDNGGEVRETNYALFIFGHLRAFEANGSERLNWQVHDYVSAGDIIGYVDRDATNGDGREHLHLGLRLMSADEARETDPRAWFRGYDESRVYRHGFADPVEFINRHIAALEECGKNDSAENDNELRVAWQFPRGASYAEVSGRVRNERNEEIVPWHILVYDTRDGELFVTLPLAQNHSFEFSIEYTWLDETRWSCEGNGIVNGSFSAEWNGHELPVVPVPNGVGGCNLFVRADTENSPNPAPQNDSAEEEEHTELAEDPAEEESGSGEAESELADPSDAENTIFCERRDGYLRVNINGRISETLIDDPITEIGFLSAGSDVTGWRTQTSPPEYFTIYNGDAFPHILLLPRAVMRFNVWAGGPRGTGWLMLWEWTAGGVCRIAAEDGGWIIRHD